VLAWPYLFWERKDRSKYFNLAKKGLILHESQSKIPFMKIKFLILSVLLLLGISCKKSPSANPVVQSNAYLNTSAGSSWNYKQIDSSGPNPVISQFTLTSTTGDTSINGRDYHVYSNSAGGNEYQNKTGNNYYQFDSLPTGFGTGAFERLYLIDSAYAGTSWSQTQTLSISGFPFPVPVTISYNIAGRNISMAVNNTVYSNVIQVSANLSSSLIPADSLATSINSYYAPKYGLILSSTKINLHYSGIIENINLFTSLVSSNLK
jgi:hypothetical protein